METIFGDLATVVVGAFITIGLLWAASKYLYVREDDLTEEPEQKKP